VPSPNRAGRILLRLVLAGIGGVALPVLYAFLIQAVAILVHRWHPASDQFVDALIFPLIWPMLLYDWIFPLPPLESATLMVSRDEFPRSGAIMAMIIWNFLFCSFLTYALVCWIERKRQRRAQENSLLTFS
jgi:hypothetical protein